MFVSVVYISEIVYISADGMQCGNWKYASASVYLCINLWWRGGGSWWREREILVQLNLINSEMEIISAWSTGERWNERKQ